MHRAAGKQSLIHPSNWHKGKARSFGG